MSSLPLHFKAICSSLVLSFAVLQSASAQTAIQWTGTSNTTFSVGSNWSGGTAPADDLTTNTALFNGTVTANLPSITASRSIAGLVFQTSTGGWTLGTSASGNILTIGSSGVTSSNTSGINIINASLKLGADQSWTIGTGGTLRFGGASFNNNGYSANITGSGTFDIRSTGGSTFSGQISSTSLTFNSNANFTITNSANSFTNMTINSGRIKFSSVGNYGQTSAAGTGGTNAAIVVGSSSGNAIFEYTGNTSSTNRTFSRDSRSTGSGIDVTTSGQTLTISGAMSSNIGAQTADTSWNFGGAGNLVLNGIISNHNTSGFKTGIIKTGAGTLTLGGNNTFTGNISISAGMLQIGSGGSGGALSTSSSIINNADLAFNRNAITQGIDFASVISGTGNLTQLGTGTLTLNGTNTYTGATTINGGTLSIAAITNGGVAGNLGNSTNAAGNLVLGGGALLYTGSDGSTDRNFTLTASTTSEINVSNAASTLTISGTSASTNGSLTKNGTGTLVLSGNNGHSGATTINAGTLVLSGTNTGSAITINSGGSLVSATSLGSTTVNSGGKIAPGTAAGSVGSLTVAGLTLNSNGTYTWDMSNATGAAGTGWDQVVSSGLLTIGATSGSKFTIAITSSGVPSNWDYTSSGQTWDIITYGSLSGFDPNKFNYDLSGFNGSYTTDSSWALSDTGTALRLTYTYSASTPTWSGASGNWTTGFSPALTNAANAAFAGSGGTATNNIPTGTLTSVGSITFSGTGAYTLEADSGAAGYDAASALAIGAGITNTSSGTQTINLATSFATSQSIAASNGNIVIGGAVAVANGATLTVNGASNTTINGQITGAGSLAKDGAGSLLLGGNNTYTGTTSIASGTLEVGSAGRLGGGDYTQTISNNGTFIYSGTNNQTLSGVISGSGALTHNGSGTLTLAATNTYNGITTVNAGTLSIGSSENRLGTTPASFVANQLTLNGGTLAVTGGSLSANRGVTLGTNGGTINVGTGNSFTVGSVITGAGALTKTGDGTIFLAANTYSGGFVLNEGVIRPSQNSVASGGVVTSGAVGTGTATIDGGRILVGGAPSLYANQWVFNSDFIVSSGNQGAANTATLLMSGPINLSNAERTITFWNFYANATAALAGQNMRFTTNVATTISNGTLRLARDASGGASDFASIDLNGAATFLSGAGLTLGSNVITVMSAADPFGSTAGDQPKVTIESGGYLNMSSSTIARSPQIRTLAGEGVVTSLATSGTSTLTINAQNGDSATFLGQIVDGSDLNATLGTSAAAIVALTKSGLGTQILSGNNTYTGATTINAGTLQIGAGGASGAIAATSGVTNNGTLAYNRSDALTAAYAISGTGDVIKDGVGTLTLSGNNSYSGGTTLNTGTLVIGNTAAAGSGSIVQTSNSSLLKVDVTGTINNAISVYTLLVSQSATLSGAVTVNNATFEVDPGDTLTISSTINGTGGVTKNGEGALILSGSNTYSGATTVNAGTLEAAHANALGTNGNVTVTGGSLLVGADDAINAKTISLNKAISGNASAAQAALAFDTPYSNTIGTAGSLTLNQDSIIDLGTGGVVVHFSEIANLNSYILHIFNWEGDTVWSGSPGGGKDQFYVDKKLSDLELSNIRFYSGLTESSFLSTGFQLGLGSSFQNEVIAVPEPETWATAATLLAGAGVAWLRRRRKPSSF